MSICMATKGMICGSRQDTRPIIFVVDSFEVEVLMSESLTVEVIDLTETQAVGVSSEMETHVEGVSDSCEIQTITGELRLDIEG